MNLVGSLAFSAVAAEPAVVAVAAAVVVVVVVVEEEEGMQDASEEGIFQQLDLRGSHTASGLLLSVYYELASKQI